MPVNNISLTSPYHIEAQDIERRRRLAEALSQKSMESQPTEVIGGWAIPHSPLQGAARLAQAVAGSMGSRKATEESTALSERHRKALASAMMGMPQPRQEISMLPTGQAGTVDEIGAPQTQERTVQPSMQDNASWLGQLAQVGPEAVSMGGTMLGMQQKEREGDENRNSRREDRIMRLEAEARSEARSMAERAERQRQADLLRRDLAADADRRTRDLAADADRRAREMQQFMLSNRQPQQPQVIQTADGPMTLQGGVAVPITGPGGAQVKPPAGRTGPMSATAQRELIETEEQLQGGQSALGLFKQARAINDKAMGFTGAGALASAGTLLPGAIRPATVEATQELDNILQTAALPQLKAIFGGMPTEGERKILLDVQGSSNKPAEVRKGIFDRAEKAIQARVKFAAEKATRLREGTYFTGEGLPSLQGGQGAPAAGGLSAEEQAELSRLRHTVGNRRRNP